MHESEEKFGNILLPHNLIKNTRRNKLNLNLYTAVVDVSKLNLR